MLDVLAVGLLLLALNSVLSVAPAIAGNPLPTVTAVSPDIGSPAGGTEVTITGTGFVGRSVEVAFGATPATDVGVTSPTTITAMAPAHAAGSVDVTVTSTDTSRGMSATDALDLFSYGPPRVTGLSPGSGPLFGGTQVTVTGTSFSPDANVSFGNLPATNVTVTSARTLIATAPPGVNDGVVNVTVTTPSSDGGTSATSFADLYAYAAPKVTSLAPGTSPADTVTPVTITGSDFSPGDSVGFGTAPATKVIVWSPKVITAIPPATLRGSTNVTVTNAVGKSPTSVAARFAAVVPTATSISQQAGSRVGGDIESRSCSPLPSPTGTSCNSVGPSSVSDPGHRPDALAPTATFLSLTPPSTPWWAVRWTPSANS